MSVTRWRPFNTLNAIQDLFDSVFEDTFLTKGEREYEWLPAVDIKEKENEIDIKAELPGIEKDKVKVEIEDGTLKISGEKVEEKEEKDTKYYRSERRYGKFQRMFRLPDNIDTDKIGAKFENGVLSITLPKKEVKKTKAVKIEVK